jgi:hypothetical protein
LIIAFKDRYVAEKMMYGPAVIPSVGKVEYSWVANPVSASGSHRDDEDSIMEQHIHEPEPSADRRDAHHEVDYDVAEVDDAWGIE